MAITRKKGPLYLQIKKIIKERILHGVYPLGSIIPSEPQLENEFQVSKMTVRNAIQELSQEGYVEKRSGIGTRVIRNTSLSKLSKGKRFTELLVEDGHQIVKRHLQTELITNEAGTELHRMFGGRCIRIERLYMLDGKPYIHYAHYLQAAVFAGVEQPEDLAAQSLYDLIEEQVSLVNFRDQFTTSAADANLAGLLQVSEGTSLLKRLRHSYDEEGGVVEFSIGHYNTEMQSYIVSYDV